MGSGHVLPSIVPMVGLIILYSGADHSISFEPFPFN